jgi:hypothetical protein
VAPENGTEDLGESPMTDAYRLYEHFWSDHGGTFDESEIFLLPHATWRDVDRELRWSHVDYLLVYFSGHGYTNQSGQRMLALQDQNVPDTALLAPACPRQWLIADACQGYSTGVAMGEFSLRPERYIYPEDTVSAREAFNRITLSSPPGKKIVHAVQAGAYTLNHPDGGVFSKFFLKVCQQTMQETGDFVPVRMEEIVVKMRGIYQVRRPDLIPEIISLSGSLQVPFALRMPEAMPSGLYPSFPIMALEPTRPAVHPLGVAVLLGLGLALLFSGTEK